MKAKKKPAEAGPGPVRVQMRSDVTRRIRQHARTSMKAEVCGVLIGHGDDPAVVIDACIQGFNASQGGAHVTFTQDTWEHIYHVKDRDFPDSRIVGWYHSHPGFGVFLSEHDLFIQQNFFSAPNQVAWVFDPHTDEEGCFGWVNNRVERLRQLTVQDDGMAAAEGRPPVDEGGIGDAMAPSREQDHSSAATPWSTVVFTVFSYLAVFLLGAVLSFFLLPRVVLVQDPGQPAGPAASAPASSAPPPAAASRSQEGSHP